MADKIRYEKNGMSYEIKPKKLKVKKWFIFLIVPSIIILFLSFIMLFNSVSLKGKKQLISYVEKGKVNYEVDLKENNHYSEKTLGENMKYISNLIDKVNINYNYDLYLTKKMDYDYSYKVKGYLKVTDKTDKTKVLYNDDYLLLDKDGNKSNSNNLKINELINLDYEKYNSIVSSFKKDYSLISYAEIVLKLEIQIKGIYDGENVVVNDNLDVTIPLSEQTIDIEKSANLNKEGNVEKPFNTKINNIVLFIIGIILFIIGFSMLVFAFYLYITRYNNNPYEKALHKLLKEYDSYIISAKSSFVEREENLIRVERFNELLDAQRLEDRPILFYEVEKGRKSYFVINGLYNTYRFTLTLSHQLELKRMNNSYLKEGQI